MAGILDTMTDSEKAVYRKIKLKEMHEYNQDFMDDLGLVKADFNMKYPFTKDGLIVVGLFDNEFKRPKGFYFEIIDNELNPADENRTIYRVPYNEFYADEFQMDERGKFLVPLEQLKKINRQSAAIIKESVISEAERNKDMQDLYVPPKPPLPFSAEQKPAQQKLEDCPYSEMTIRDYIAIHTGKPISNKAWLNEIVKSNK